ncbi:hypothetical protein MN210_03445 [Psychrobacter raelei]|uniref:Uncharacterized protein n=1 Tax=Psychrobacter raelei TaxID=2565531 RepID=A0AAT9PG75_9GAMM|nr:hypothetical protein [Psychrobacter sp. PraFG1]UNK05853.1 hypothetical protein MN210_03445 [Psychrobacter sp. PraFG1]
MKNSSGSILVNGYAENFNLVIYAKEGRTYYFTVRIIRRIEGLEDEIVRETTMGGMAPFTGNSTVSWSQYFMALAPYLDVNPPVGKSVTYVFQAASSTSSYVHHQHSVTGLTLTATGVKR